MCIYYISHWFEGMMNTDEFALEIFDTLARRLKLDISNGITIDELKKFWDEMTDQNFDSRLRIFFDM